MTSKQNDTLPRGSVLLGKENVYTIDKVLGQGSFGITYHAHCKARNDSGDIHKDVCVKEFFMHEINGRDGLLVTTGKKEGLFSKYRHKFIGEAKRLQELQYPHIVKVEELFEANNTVYYAMQLINGGTLDNYISKKGGRLSEKETLEIAEGIVKALDYMHLSNMLHLDVKPSNVMMQGKRPILIDFGLSKQYDENGIPESSTTVGGGTPGYSPIEQTNHVDDPKKELPVTMDVYALGATMFKMLTGHRPPVATEIFNSGFPKDELREVGASESVMALIMWMMEMKKKDRPQNMRYVLHEICKIQSTFPDEVSLGPSKGGEKTIIDAPNGPTVIIEPKVYNGKVYEVNGVKFTMIEVDGGTFMMGSNDSEAKSDEKPVHTVTLDSYMIGQTQVTQKLWEAVMGVNPSHFKGEDLPVDSVNWEDCQKFITKLNKLTGESFRLPTEAEWEFAARGGTKSKNYKYSGSDNIDDVAWYGENSKNTTHAVGKKSSNELGVYDMSGNVREWCQDKYDNGYYAKSPLKNPVGPDVTGFFNRIFGYTCVIRGGCYSYLTNNCRVAYRNYNNPYLCENSVGLRLAL